MKQVGNTILAKGGNHILAKRDNSAWPKGSKLSGFSTFVDTQIAEERRNYYPLPELLRELSVTHYIIVYFSIFPKRRYHQLCRVTNR